MIVNSIAPYNVLNTNSTDKTEAMPQYASTLTFKGNDGTPHKAPRTSTPIFGGLKRAVQRVGLALGLTTAAVASTGCPDADVDATKVPPEVTVKNPNSTATATATSTATNTSIIDKSPKSIYMGKMQAAGVIGPNANTYEGASWFDENALTSVDETVTKDTADTMVVHGKAIIPGGEVEYDHTFTTNPDGSARLVRTVNGRQTQEFKVTSQTRTIGGKAKTFADFQCISGDCFNYSVSAEPGTGKVLQFGNDNFVTPIDILSKYKVKVDGQEPTLVQRAIQKVRFTTKSGGATIQGIANNVPTLAGKFSRLV